MEKSRHASTHVQTQAKPPGMREIVAGAARHSLRTRRHVIAEDLHLIIGHLCMQWLSAHPIRGLAA